MGNRYQKSGQNNQLWPVISIGFHRKPSLIEVLVGLEFGVCGPQHERYQKSSHHVLLLGAIPPFLLVLNKRACCIADL